MPDMDDAPVFFLLPDGTEISDDPRWKANKFRSQLEQQSANLAEMARFAAEEQARQDAILRAEEEGEDDPEDMEPEVLSKYDQMTVPELKAAAKELDLDITGLKKRSELVNLLRTAEE